MMDESRYAEQMVRYMAERDFGIYMRYINPELEMTKCHRSYYAILNKFAHKEIRKLIISAPPQFGKSLGSSRGLPSFLMGMRPSDNIVIGSYNTELARTFNSDVQRMMREEAYGAVFPYTIISDGRENREYKCNADETQVVGEDGSGLRVVGRGSSLTGRKVDVMIMDDLYKDYNEASSPIVRNKTWRWYTSVVLSRLQDWGQQLMVFTRWNEDDLIGRIMQTERVVKIERWEDFDKVGDDWAYVNFPAIKVGAPTEIDPREEGEVIFPSHSSLKTLLAKKKADPYVFECLYQGNPFSEDNKLYGEFKTYTDKSEYGVMVRKGCCIDVAGKGGDDTCSICYDVYRSKNNIYNEQTRRFEPLVFILVTDIYLSNAGVEETSIVVPQQINMQGSQVVWCERNAGGEQFGMSIAKKVRAKVELYFSEGNKEARIINSVGDVMSQIIFPLGWESRWPKAFKELNGFVRHFKANAHDDVPDVLSSIVQREILCKNPTRGYVGYKHRGIRRAN